MNELQEQPRRQRSLIVKNLVPGLTERGKIKIGRKGQAIQSNQGKTFQPPQKIDHFLVTTLERDQGGNFRRDDAIHKAVGDQPKRLPVRLLYDDIELNFQCRYVAYDGRTLVRSCDGELCEQRQQNGRMRATSCQCAGRDPFDQGVCKIHGVLSIMLDQADIVGGVWKFRTTSYNTVQGILSSLALIKRVTGGPLAGIPLDLVVNPKSVANPRDGKQQTVYVVHLEFRGSMEQLQQRGYQIALNNEKHRMQIDRIEDQARALLAGPDVDGDDETVDEFFPEQAAQAEGVPYEEPGAGTLAAPEPDASTAAPAPSEAAEPATSQQPAQGGVPLINADGEIVQGYRRIGDYLNALEKLAEQGRAEEVLSVNADALDRIAAERPKSTERIAEIREKFAPSAAETSAPDATADAAQDDAVESGDDSGPADDTPPATEGAGSAGDGAGGDDDWF